MVKFVSFLIRLALLLLGLVAGYFIGSDKGYNTGYKIGFERGIEDALSKQKLRSIEEVKNELKTREIEKIKEFIDATAKIQRKDEGSLFTVKYVQYLTGTITNSAIVATVKDIKLRIIYFSKTNSEIGSQEITVYEYIKPGQTVSFSEKVSVPEQVSEFKYQIIDVNANN